MGTLGDSGLTGCSSEPPVTAGAATNESRESTATLLQDPRFQRALPEFGRLARDLRRRV